MRDDQFEISAPRSIRWPGGSFNDGTTKLRIEANRFLGHWEISLRLPKGNFTCIFCCWMENNGVEIPSRYGGRRFGAPAVFCGFSRKER